MERKTGMAGFVAVTVLLVLFTALFFGMTAWSGEDKDAAGRKAGCIPPPFAADG